MFRSAHIPACDDNQKFSLKYNASKNTPAARNFCSNVWQTCLKLSDPRFPRRTREIRCWYCEVLRYQVTTQPEGESVWTSLGFIRLSALTGSHPYIFRETHSLTHPRRNGTRTHETPIPHHHPSAKLNLIAPSKQPQNALAKSYSLTQHVLGGVSYKCGLPSTVTVETVGLLSARTKRHATQSGLVHH